jgi:hypothetical protein
MLSSNFKRPYAHPIDANGFHRWPVLNLRNDAYDGANRANSAIDNAGNRFGNELCN